jgi:hypothetical protein
MRKGDIPVSNSDLRAEQLVVLPMRLETITIKAGDVTQGAWLDQSNFSNQVGGDCKLSSCDQFNVGVNVAEITQRTDQDVDLTDVIEDNRRLFQLFGS